MSVSVTGTIRGMATRANPVFGAGAVLVPVALLVGAALFGTTQQLTHLHVMAGVLWTGIDLFIALVLGPVLGGLAVEQRAAVFQRFTPKMTFLMPTLAFTAIFGGMVWRRNSGCSRDWRRGAACSRSSQWDPRCSRWASSSTRSPTGGG